MLLTVLVLAIILSVLVFVHEFGHFTSAKLLGIKVEEFGFGFPPKIFGVKRGDTEYTVNWIPLGGFVRIKGEAGEATSEPDSFAGRPAWQRILVLCAGVFMNFLLTWSLMTFGYVIGLPQIAEDLPAHARVANSQIQVYSVLADTPAADAALLAGDTIVSVDGQAVSDVNVFRDYTGSHAGQPVRVDFTRDGKPLEKMMTPRLIKGSDRVGFGIAIVRTGLVSYPLWVAPWRGLQDTVYFIEQIFSAFGTLFSDLFHRQPVSVDFSGPVGIAVITSDVIKLGFRHLVQFAALLSINLAVVNILPFPALDGGRAVFVIVEKLRGRKKGLSWENWAHQIGFAVLLLLVAIVTVQDVIKFGGRIWTSLGL